MKSTSLISATILALAAVLAANASLAQGVPVADTGRAAADLQQAMLTIPQALTIAEVTQAGTAYSLKREAAGADVVYHVKVSTPDRGVVDVHVKAFGGRVEVQPHHRD